jgi:hypothetical protein
MDHNKSLDELELIAALLYDAHLRYGDVFNTRSLRLTVKLCLRRYRLEGIGFLTKTLPRLGKHFEQVLSESTTLNPFSVGFTTLRGTKLPRFLGELFSLVFSKDGALLPNPDASCVKMILDILYCFYKYKLPYTDVQEREIVNRFCKAEDDLAELDILFARLREDYVTHCAMQRSRRSWDSVLQHRPEAPHTTMLNTIRGARKVLDILFMHFDPTDIVPSHGPGAVSTKERLWEKFQWTNISSRIAEMYPIDAYFYTSAGHVCDRVDGLMALTSRDNPARVILVPKDSRGPRLISCEPVDFQWVQQGLSRAIVRNVESHWISRYNVFFTDQEPNQRGALLGSSSSRYVTLDLKEASDRVHLELVRLLFPDKLLAYLEACRSTSTELPDGKILKLRKFAPMGSALCFPVMALTIWSLLTAVAPDADTREGILVYGDDVIVPTAFAESAMSVLESFGLKINRDKSCIKGSYRESCGVNAFKGTRVTPVRIRTVWSESPRPDVYTSWIAYANSYWDRQYYTTYEYIVSRLVHIYGPIPDESLVGKRAPSLRVAPAEHGSFKTRFNKHLQKREYLVRVVTSPSVNHEIDGWSMLLRYFTEAQRPSSDFSDRHSGDSSSALSELESFSVSRYTKRGTSLLVKRWR